MKNIKLSILILSVIFITSTIFISCSSENEDNIEVIVNFYINAIADTQVLKNSDKNALISSFSVASESPTYWLNQN